MIGYFKLAIEAMDMLERFGVFLVDDRERARRRDEEDRRSQTCMGE